MDLKERITAYIIKTAPVTMDTVIDVATAKGFTESEVLATLEQVHKDKRITQTASTDGVVTYKLTSVKERPDPQAWLRANYPWPDKDWTPPFPEIDLGALFLRNKEERDAYTAAAKGLPVHMVKSKRVNARR